MCKNKVRIVSFNITSTSIIHYKKTKTHTSKNYTLHYDFNQHQLFCPLHSSIARPYTGSAVAAVELNTLLKGT